LRIASVRVVRSWSDMVARVQQAGQSTPAAPSPGRALLGWRPSTTERTRAALSSVAVRNHRQQPTGSRSGGAASGGLGAAADRLPARLSAVGRAPLVGWGPRARVPGFGAFLVQIRARQPQCFLAREPAAPAPAPHGRTPAAAAAGTSPARPPPARRWCALCRCARWRAAAANRSAGVITFALAPGRGPLLPLVAVSERRRMQPAGGGSELPAIFRDIQRNDLYGIKRHLSSNPVVLKQRNGAVGAHELLPDAGGTICRACALYCTAHARCTALHCAARRSSWHPALVQRLRGAAIAAPLLRPKH
jgi:hypothetical protein